LAVPAAYTAWKYRDLMRSPAVLLPILLTVTAACTILGTQL